MFRHYTGLGTPDPVDFIGKQETLVEDLVHVLDRLGVEHKPEKLARAERVNFASGGVSASWTPELRKLVLRAERRALIDYGYDAQGPRSGRRGRPAARTRPINHPPRYQPRLLDSADPASTVSTGGSRIKRFGRRVLPRAAQDFIRARRSRWV
jgi:hypothetical protein